jgi:solute carrier family 29 (equilibrative nucleoside transporter), member 1/2/3
MASSMASIEEAERAARKTISLVRLFGKLHWLCLALFITFAATMFYPVFSAKITSVNWPRSGGALLSPAVFIPLAQLFWNSGDLAGRVLTALPFSLGHRPFVLFLMSVVRVAWIPLYMLCNVGGMAASSWVDEGEREAAGSFMGLCLVFGLTVGSLLTFTVADI